MNTGFYDAFGGGFYGFWQVQAVTERNFNTGSQKAML